MAFGPNGTFHLVWGGGWGCGSNSCFAHELINKQNKMKHVCNFQSLLEQSTPFVSVLQLEHQKYWCGAKTCIHMCLEKINQINSPLHYIISSRDIMNQ